MSSVVIQDTLVLSGEKENIPPNSNSQTGNLEEKFLKCEYLEKCSYEYINNNEKRCITLYKPELNRHALDPVSMRNWVKLHSNEHQALLMKVLHNLEFINQSSFEFFLRQCTQSLLEDLQGSPFTLLYEKKKSTQWVPLLAYSLETSLPSSVWKELGEKQGSKFCELLEKKYRNFSKNIEHLLQAARKGDIEARNDSYKKCESILKSIPKALVIFDDASYSGKQLFDHAQFITKGLKEFHGSIETRLNELNPYLKAINLTPFENFSFPQLKIVCPILSSKAQEKLHALEINSHLVPFKVYHSKVFPNLVEVLSADEAIKLSQLWGDKIFQQALFYLDHKCANDVSFPSQIKDGTVAQSKKQGKIAKITSPFFLCQEPPYKHDNACSFTCYPQDI